MKIDTIEKFVMEELKDAYGAEKQITRALQKMIKAAGNEELKAALKEHLEVTKQQIAKLDQVWEMFGSKPKSKKCEGMEGIITEGEEIMEEDITPEILDVALIASAQRVEHYEIAAYGSLREYAKLLGMPEAAAILQEILNEEGEADKKLTKIAQRANKLALKAGMS